jgi:hypothetical protein
MGEAKRRGTFDERRQQAMAKRAALFAARTPQPERPDVAMPRRNVTQAAMLMALATMACRQGVFVIRRSDDNEHAEVGI